MKKLKAAFGLLISTKPGKCCWCGCTDDRPCANGCSWVERSHTLCSECVPLDKAMHTAAGRRELAEFLQEQGFLVGQAMPVAARAARRRLLRRPRR